MFDHVGQRESRARSGAEPLAFRFAVDEIFANINYNENDD